MPKISVLIPVYNGAELVGRALDSVFAQTFRDFEVIVLDDGSTDGSAEVADRAGVRVLRQPNRGIGFSRRRLVLEAQGEWLAFLDHDDWWHPAKLERQVAAIGSEIGLIHTRDTFVFPDGREVRGRWSPSKDATALDHVLPDCQINTCSTLLRKSAVLEAGNFPPDVSRAEDWLLWLLLAGKWQFTFVDEALTYTYKREGSASQPNSLWFEGERYVLEQCILPRFDELYAGYDRNLREWYRACIGRKLGAIASLQAEALEREGRGREALPLHLEAIRRSPSRKGAWLRLGRHLARR